jgi:hypothetical protein
VAAMLIGTLVSVFAMVFYISRKGTAEVSEFASHRKMWRI